MSETTAATIAALEHHGAALASLAGRLRLASAVQWDRAPHRAASVDAYHIGGAADPTPRIAGDHLRLTVRAAVISAESALAASADMLESASAGVDRALDGWHSR